MIKLKNIYLHLFFIFFIGFFILKADILKSNSTIVLEGLYATSVNVNYDKYGPHKIFTGKQDYWSTLPGASVDEGFMLYFQEKTYIEAIEFEMPQSQYTQYIGTIIKIQVVANGVDMGVHYILKKIKIRRKLLSLYIRIIEVSDMYTKTVKSDLRGFKKVEKSYKAKLPVAVSEMILYGKNNTPLKIIPPRMVKGDVIGSSTLMPEEAYSIDYLFDSKKDSGWVEGKKGPGTGETIEFILNKSIKISKIKIWNGMHMSRKHFIANERIKKISFGTSASDSSMYNIKDTIKPQIINLKSAISGKKFLLKINKIYRGTAYTDLVISEIRFYDSNKNNWFLVFTGVAQKRKKRNLARIRGTVLEKIVDKQLKVEYKASGSMKSRSIILRSNNSFVIWLENKESGYGADSYNRKVLDGFWDIRSLNKSNARIRLLGKIFRLSEEFEVYKGDVKTERVSIFGDTLYIDSNSIKGRKHLGKITY